MSRPQLIRIRRPRRRNKAMIILLFIPLCFVFLLGFTLYILGSPLDSREKPDEKRRKALNNEKP
jgi:hypothetical protein